ncbi:MAG TPA: transglutaminase-like domain-containing protein [Candidatus Limnocylindria bacterium]|nr:transglutaminase-like domain-containing protein [Candidatus Limnocylindria bacterium]
MLAKQSIGVAIVLFWCVMTALLIKRQIGAPPPVITLSGGEKISENIEEWWGVFYRGEKIGYASQTITPKAKGYLLRDQSVLHLNLLGAVQPAATRLEMEANEDWILERFEFELNSKEIRFGARGSVRENTLSLEVDSAGHRSSHEVTLTQAPYLLAALKPYVVTQQLETGKKFFFSTFDPSTLSQQVTTVVIEGREQIRIGDRTEPAIKLRQSFRGISVVSWVDGQGRTLKEESPAGLSLLRQSVQEARNLPNRGVSLDIVAQTAIPVTTTIADAQSKPAIRLKLSGINLGNFPLDGGRQRLDGDRLEIRREGLKQVGAQKLPFKDARLASYLQPTPFLQSDHPSIRALSASIRQGETNALRAALRIKDWVYKEIAKEPTVSIPNALEVLRTKKGDCNEHTVLFNALARAAGIPAKTVVGVVYLRDAFYYHAWSEIWLGEWVSLDSVLNQFPADVTHVKFLEGDIDRQIDLLQLIGNLKIEVIGS